MNRNITILLGIGIIFVTTVGLLFINDLLIPPLDFSNEDINDFEKHPLRFNETKSFNHLKNQVEIGYRYPGTVEINFTRSYIVKYLNIYNWKIYFHNFTIEGIDVSNILAFPGDSTNETLSSTILFGAHYDTRITADRDFGENRSLPVLGANDGASGVAILLELARIYNSSRNIGLLFIDAEDQGGIGSAIPEWYWIEGSTAFAQELDKFFPSGANSIASFVLFDMIGDKNLNVWKTTNSDVQLINEIWFSAEVLGYQDYFEDNFRTAVIDDHVPFRDQGIPSIDLIDFDYVDQNNNNLHHTTRDNLDYVSAESLKIIGETIEFWLRTKGIWST
ncbi:MAG: M28 family peptidase [Candidatus Hodarchaeales archaeon]|jgi:hypothetical protein